MKNPGHILLRMLLLGAAYAVAGRFSVMIAIPPGYATAVWPAAGVGLAGLLVLGLECWPGLLLGSLITNLPNSLAHAAPAAAWQLSIGIAVGATLEAVFGAAVTGAIARKRPLLASTADILKFLLMGGPIACLISATIGILSLHHADLISSGQMLEQWWTWWLGDSIGVLMVAPALFILLQQPPVIRRAVSIGVPMLVVGLIIAILVSYNNRLDANAHHRPLDWMTRDLTLELRGYLDALEGVQSALDAVPDLSREQFHALVQRELAQHRGITALEWAPRVSAAERGRYSITERVDGKMVPATARDVYYPVAYVEPLAGNEAAVGFDLFSNPHRRDTLQRAERSGLPACSASLHLVQGPNHSVLVAAPVRSGFAIEVFQVADVLRPVLLDRKAMLEDATNVPPEQLFKSDGMPADADSEEFPFADRRWRLSVDIAAGGSPFSRLVLLLTIVMAVGFMSALLLIVTGRTAEVENMVRERTSQLEAANAAKTLFLANVSHELRTPLNGILGMTELALDEPLPAAAKEHIEVAHRSAQILAHLIEDVLDFSAIDAGRIGLVRKPFAFVPQLQQVVTLIRHAAEEKQVTLETQFDAALPAAVDTDGARLQQVLLNLMGNAVKFSPHGKVTLRVGPDGDRVRFEVVDSGIGIAPENLARIFEPFSQADATIGPRFGGTGLGLPIARSVIAALGGKLNVESTPGQGSRFWFSLVLPPVILPGAPAADAPAARHGQRLLVADDNLLNQTLARAMLEPAGHEVVCVSTGVEVLEKLSQQPGHFDVVLMDVRMPDMDGMETTRRIRDAERENGRHQRIIAMTANADATDVQACKAAGMDDYIAKPIDRRRLLAIIEGKASP